RKSEGKFRLPIEDKVRVVYAGCGVNALSGLQTAQIQYIAEKM
ncbi:hypothetical protein ECP029894210_0848, partial [Escherichia coli P0298942.10]